MDREWAAIAEFPDYLVSSYGDIVHETTNRVMRQSTTIQGDLKVGLVNNGRQYTRAVKVLVARAFVPGESALFNTPIQLDGYQTHCFAWNLQWRPRWFAWKYTRQFSIISEIHRRGPVYDTGTRIKYADIYEAATTNGLLIQDVWRSIHSGIAVFPTGQRFELVRP